MSSPTALIFGRYVPGISVVHALDARCKLTLLLVFIAANVITTTPVAVVLCAAFVIAAYCAARISARAAFTCVGPLLIKAAPHFGAQDRLPSPKTACTRQFSCRFV